jgi:hypothetical protein
LHLMGVPKSEVGYTLATIVRGDHEVHEGHVVALEREKQKVQTKTKAILTRRQKKLLFVWPSEILSSFVS